MVLPKLLAALESMEGYKTSGDGRNCSIRCPFCGGSTTDTSSLSIKIDVDPKEPIWYQCFRASCGAKGVLTTSKLQEMGITGMDVLMEVGQHNRNINPSFDKPFHTRSVRDYKPVNLNTISNQQKMDYINRRLGYNFTEQDLSDLKIQLSLFDLLEVNDIQTLSVRQNYAQMLNAYCIGFLSIYNDYLVCRDITPDRKTGMRYYTYRISGQLNPDDIKIYSIPREIDIMSPRSTEINVAEGPFSILGAYINTDYGNTRPNSVWLANCGSQYENTIMRICKQYGLLKVRINIWSDSEIKLGAYKKLYNQLKNRLDIRSFTVLYNSKKEDFGYDAEHIRIQLATIK